MLRFGRRIGVAVSGGADSAFLLEMLARLELAAGVIHVNHGLRGTESDGDELFVRELAAQYMLPFAAFAGPVEPGNMEQEARRVRYGHFSAAIADGFCDAVATGHNRDDQAETVLFRFLRGSGTAGLSGILPVTESRTIRPLLNLGRDEIRQWLRENGRSWREDCTNSDVGFARNRIRLEVMPVIGQFNPQLAATLASTAEWAREEENYWAAEIDRIEPEYVEMKGPCALIELDSFARLPVAVERRLLRRAVARVAGGLRSIGFEHIEGIRGMMAAREGSGRVQLPGLDIYRSFDWLRLGPPGVDSRLERDFSMALEVPGVTRVPERDITLKIESVNNFVVYNKQVNALDRDKCAGALELRNWRPGDRIWRETASGIEKIKTLFQEFRVPLWERRNWPVIVRGESVLWTRGFGPDRSVAAGRESNGVLLIEEGGESNRTFQASMNRKRASARAGCAETAPASGEPPIPVRRYCEFER